MRWPVARLLSPERAALLYALSTGLAMAIGVQTSPHGIRPVVDEAAMIEWAREISRGRLVGDEVFYIDPLAGYFFGAIFALTHGSLFAARLVYVLLGAGTVAVIGALARELFSRREGAVAMWLLALYGPHVFLVGFVLKEALTVHLTAWALWLALLAQGKAPRPRLWAALGAVGGLLVLSRGHFAAVIPFLCLWAVFQALRGPGPPRARGMGLLAFGLGLGLALAPASLHNWVAAKSLMPITVMGGQTFWLGNNPQATGAYESTPWAEGRPEPERDGYRAEAERRLGRKLTLRESSAYWRDLGLAFWETQPREAMQLTLLKLWLVVHDYEIPDNYGFTCFRTYFTPVLWLTPLGFGALLGLAAWGAARAVVADKRARFAVGFAALYAASVAMFIVFDRYRIPLCLVLCLFAAHSLVWAWDEARARGLKPLGGLALSVVAAGLVAFIPTPISRWSEERDAFCVGQAGLMLYADGLTDAAKPLFDEARRRGRGAPFLDPLIARIDAGRAGRASPHP